MDAIISSLQLDAEKPIVLIDHEGTVIFINELFELRYGWQSADLVGKAIHHIIPKNLHDAHNVGFSRYLSTEEATLMNQPLPLQIVKKDGESVEAIHIIKAIKKDENWLFGATIG